MTRLAPGQPAPLCSIELISGETIDLADGRALTHVQFRRFAGCPVCNLHLRSFVRRWSELKCVVREVVVFHSRGEDVNAYASDLPFYLVADAEKSLYRAFGVEAGAHALLDSRAWAPILRAIAAGLAGVVFDGRRIPPLFPRGGRLGLPADFLVGPDGRIIAAHYGDHVDDHWSVDEVLARATGMGAQPRYVNKAESDA